MKIDYDFCRKAKLVPLDLIIWLGLDDKMCNINPELYSWDFFGRNMMIVESAIRISCVKKDFDKWSNSEDYWFDISKKSEKNDFIEWVIEQRNKEESV